jgi:hypothetical protein
MDYLKDIAVGSYHYFKLGTEHKNPGIFLYYSTSHSAATGVATAPLLLRLDDLPDKAKGSTRIIAVSDTHARHEGVGPLPEGDIFIHTGDILMTSSIRSHSHGMSRLTEFDEWLDDIPCEHKVVIAGNHDHVIEKIGKEATQSLLGNSTYLENSQVTLSDVTIWGTPISVGRSQNKAFQSSEFAAETQDRISEIRSPLDIVLTHGPCRAVYSTIAGSQPSRPRASAPPMHFWGHYHNGHGVTSRDDGSLSVCACIMDGRYDLSNVPVIVDYCK